MVDTWLLDSPSFPRAASRSPLAPMVAPALRMPSLVPSQPRPATAMGS